LGFIVAALNFVHSYSQNTAVELVSAHSDAVRGFDERAILTKARRAIVVVKLHGYQFFGSTLKVTSAIQSQVTIRCDSEPSEDDLDDIAAATSATSLQSRAASMASPVPMAGMCVDMLYCDRLHVL
jgi:hypothetical protein